MPHWKHEHPIVFHQCLTPGHLLCYPWKLEAPWGISAPQLMVLLRAYRVVKIHAQDGSLTKPWLPLRTQSSERISAKSSIRPFSAFAETQATACKSRAA